MPSNYIVHLKYTKEAKLLNMAEKHHVPVKLSNCGVQKELED